MKKINLKTTIIIVSCVAFLATAIFLIIITANPNNKQPIQEDIVLPQASEEKNDDKFAGSIALRKDAPSRVDLFDYQGYNIEIEEIITNSGYIKLKDGSALFFFPEKFAVPKAEKFDNGLKFEFGESFYGTEYSLEIKRIYNGTFNNIHDNQIEADYVDKYNQIKDEYFKIYSNSNNQSFMEFEGISTYSKMVDFIEENNLQYDTKLYNRTQTSDIIKKAYNIDNLDDYYEINKMYSNGCNPFPSSTNLLLIKETPIDNNNNNYDIYYLLSDGNSIYAAHLVLNIPSDLSYEDYINFIS